MAASAEVICNLALSHLGVSKSIAILGTDATPEDRACDTFYAQVIAEVQRAFAWTFCSAFGTLVEAQAVPTTEWGHCYHVPEDSLFVRRIVQPNSSRNETRQSRAPFRLVRDTVTTAWDAATTYTAGQYAKLGAVWYRCILESTNQTPPNATYWVALTGPPPMLLLTDATPVTIEYTVAVTETREFSADFTEAAAALLAAYIAPRVTQDDKGAAAARAMQLYSWLISKAEANAANEEVVDDAQPSEFERARTS